MNYATETKTNKKAAKADLMGRYIRLSWYVPPLLSTQTLRQRKTESTSKLEETFSIAIRVANFEFRPGSIDPNWVLTVDCGAWNNHFKHKHFSNQNFNMGRSNNWF